jgi:lipopolysaccharide export system protein LptA
MKPALILFAALALAASAQAAPVVKPAPAAKPVTAQHDNNAPIDIASDSFQADLNAKSGTYTGNVIITQADMKLRANMVKVTTVDGNADKVVASGNVVVDSPKSGIVTGDNGVYSVVPRIVVMTGNVVLKKGKNVMHGVQLTVNLATGQAVVSGGVKSQTGAQGNGRVHAVFLPNAQ